MENPNNHFQRCTKQHAHVREIIGAARDPAGRAIATCARALRILIKESKRPQWTLWNQAELVSEVQRRARILVYQHGQEYRCQCGRSKMPMEMVCADAAQFFKSAKTGTSIERAAALIKHLQHRIPHAVVAVAPTKRSKGFIAKSKKLVPASYTAVQLEDVLAAMKYASKDRSFLVGAHVVQRTDGWAMGGHMSAVATSVTLEHDVSRLYAHRDRARSLGWYVGKMPTPQVIQGIIHVDDTLIFSKTLCHRCIESGILRCWPRELGMEVEQRPPVLTFLHITMTLKNVVEECPVVFRPSTPNEAYAKGEMEEPMVARVCQYIKTITDPREMLRPFLAAKFACYNKLYGRTYDGSDIDHELAIMLSEILRAEWPPKVLAKPCFVLALQLTMILKNSS